MLRIVTSFITAVLFLTFLSPGTRSLAAADSPHAYFEQLVKRPEHWRSYSLREPQQLTSYRDGGYLHCFPCPGDVSYDPMNDTYPKRQDAAKVVIPGNSLRSQIRVPMRTTNGESYLITWDAWFGPEFDLLNTKMNSHKSFQFESAAIWFEIQTRFNRGGRETLGEHTARAYNHFRSRDEAFGPNVTNLDPLQPQVGTFFLKAETWTRYWVVIDQRAGDYDLTSLWIADVNTNPVQILDRLQLNTVKDSIESFWVELNASADYVPPDRGPLVAYFRNIAMLRNVVNPTSLMLRPNVGDPLPPPPPPPQRPSAPKNLRIIPPPPR